MFLPALLSLLLAADGSSAAQPTRRIEIAAPGLTAADIAPNKAQFFNDYFAQELNTRGGGRIHVTTSSEIAAILGLERQRQLLGCSDSSNSCIAELAGALGSDAVVSGTVARIGDGYAATLKLSAANDGRQLAAAQRTGLTEEQLVAFFHGAAQQFATSLLGEAAGPATTTTTSSNSSATPADSAASPERAVPSAAPTHLLRLSVLGAEYDHRLSGPLWVGGRLSFFSLVFGLPDPAQSQSFTGSAAALVRFHPLDAQQGLSYGAYVGAGAQVTYVAQSPIDPVAFAGAEVGFYWFRCSLEYQLSWSASYFKSGLSPGISVGIPL